MHANDNSALNITSFPFEMEVPEGTLTVYDGRGPDRRGYAAYLMTPGSTIPFVGVGATPDIAIMDIATVREPRT